MVEEETIANQDQTADPSMLDNVTKPIVKVLGELFSREDKKSIPTFFLSFSKAIFYSSV